MSLALSLGASTALASPIILARDAPIYSFNVQSSNSDLTDLPTTQLAYVHSKHMTGSYPSPWTMSLTVAPDSAFIGSVKYIPTSEPLLMASANGLTFTSFHANASDAERLRL
jgi:hypothetical protein